MLEGEREVCLEPLRVKRSELMEKRFLIDEADSGTGGGGAKGIGM